MGKGQTPGVVAYWLRNDGADSLNDPYQHIVVVFNASAEGQAVVLDQAEGLSFVLHPALQNGADDVVKNAAFVNTTGAFNVPPRTTAVFVVDNPEWNPAAAEVEPVSEQPASPTPSQAQAASNLPAMILGGLAVLFAGIAALFLGLKMKKK